MTRSRSFSNVDGPDELARAEVVDRGERLLGPGRDDLRRGDRPDPGQRIELAGGRAIEIDRSGRRTAGRTHRRTTCAGRARPPAVSSQPPAAGPPDGTGSSRDGTTTRSPSARRAARFSGGSGSRRVDPRPIAAGGSDGVRDARARSQAVDPWVDDGAGDLDDDFASGRRCPARRAGADRSEADPTTRPPIHRGTPARRPADRRRRRAGRRRSRVRSSRRSPHRRPTAPGSPRGRARRGSVTAPPEARLLRSAPRGRARARRCGPRVTSPAGIGAGLAWRESRMPPAASGAHPARRASGRSYPPRISCELPGVRGVPRAYVSVPITELTAIRITTRMRQPIDGLRLPRFGMRRRTARRRDRRVRSRRTRVGDVEGMDGPTGGWLPAHRARGRRRCRHQPLRSISRLGPPGRDALDRPDTGRSSTVEPVCRDAVSHHRPSADQGGGDRGPVSSSR